MAKRIAVHYGGVEYAISGREIEDVLRQVEEGTMSSDPQWLEVAIGQGRSTSAQLLLWRGVPIAVWQVNTDGGDSAREEGPADEDSY